MMNFALCGMLFAGVWVTPDEDFDKATAKAAEMSKYSFKFTQKMEGLGGRANVESDLPPADCSVDKDAATTAMKMDKVVAYKKGETLVYQGDKDEWQKYEQQKRGGGGKRRDPNQSKLASLQGIEPPHEFLGGFSKKMKEVNKAQAKGADCTVYSGPLTDEAAHEFAASTRPHAGGSDEMTGSGTAKFWVNADGAIVKFEISTSAKVKLVDREIKTTRTYEISNIGTASVTVPEGAQKVLDAK